MASTYTLNNLLSKDVILYFCKNNFSYHQVEALAISDETIILQQCSLDGLKDKFENWSAPIGLWGKLLQILSLNKPCACREIQSLNFH